jgi:hypothetical protein
VPKINLIVPESELLKPRWWLSLDEHSLLYLTGLNYSLLFIFWLTCLTFAPSALAFDSMGLTSEGKIFLVSNPTPITVTANPGQTKIFGDIDPKFEFTVDPPGTYPFTGALSRIAGGTVGVPYPITKGNLSAGANYTISFVSADFYIKAKPITVIADSVTKQYGDPDPALTYSFNPKLLTGDDFSGALERLPGEMPGEYPINSGNLTAGSNYIITFLTGVFTITKSTNYQITVTVEPGQSKVYGEPDPVLRYFVSPHLFPGDTISGSLSRDPGESTGLYKIRQGSLTAGVNYQISFVSDDLVISQKPILVRSSANKKIYDGTRSCSVVPTISPGLVEGDIGGFIQEYKDKNAGTGKTITPKGQVSSPNSGNNYEITFESVHDGIIEPLSIPVMVSVSNKVYDGSTTAILLKCWLIDVLSGDNVSVTGGAAKFITPDTGNGKSVEATGFTLSGLDSLNYSPNHIPAITTADITPLGVNTTVEVNPSSFTSLSEIATFTAIVHGGAPLEGGPPAALSATFSFEGNSISNVAGQTMIPLEASGPDLVAKLSVPLQNLTITGSMVSGTKEIVSTINSKNSNYLIEPGFSGTYFEYSTGFEIKVYPNPANPLSGTGINFQLSLRHGSNVKIELYEPSGKQIGELFNEFLEGGASKTIVYNHSLRQGVYPYRIITDNQVVKGKIVVIRVY